MPPVHHCCGGIFPIPELCTASPSILDKPCRPTSTQWLKHILQVLQQELGPCNIMEISWMPFDPQQIALCINEQMTLAAFHLLGAVRPARPSHLSGLTNWLSMIAALG